MKLQQLRIENLLALKSIDLPLREAPIWLICGSNEAGKTSVAQAITLALMGDLPRVKFKQDLDAAVRDGMKKAEVFLTTDAGVFTASLPPFKRSGPQVQADPDFLRACLSPAHFSSLDPGERRSLLYRLLSTGDPKAAVIGKRLSDKGCDGNLIDQILPIVTRSGFQTGSSYSAERGLEGKGAWKQITGESWGDKKSEGWKAAKPPYDPKLHEIARDDQKAVSAAIAELNQSIGAHNAATTHAEALQKKLNDLKPKAAKFALASENLKRAQAQIEEFKPQVLALRDKKILSLHARQISECACPACGVILLWDDGKLVERGPAPPAPSQDEVDVSKLPEYENSLGVLERSVASRQREVDEANKAATELKAIGEPAWPTDDITTLRDQLSTQMDKQRTAEKILADQESARTASTQADSKTADAGKKHAEISGWLRLAEALGPSGIPADIVTDMMAPLNDRLRYTSGLAAWKTPRVRADMEIVVGDRPITLTDAMGSERWRADLLIAEAISNLSGVKVLLIDRFDLCDIPNRVRAIALLDALARAGEQDTVLLLGTLKTMPSGLPATMRAVWIERGELRQEDKVAA